MGTLLFYYILIISHVLMKFKQNLNFNFYKLEFATLHSDLVRLQVWAFEICEFYKLKGNILRWKSILLRSQWTAIFPFKRFDARFSAYKWIKFSEVATWHRNVSFWLLIFNKPKTTILFWNPEIISSNFATQLNLA